MTPPSPHMQPSAAFAAALFCTMIQAEIGEDAGTSPSPPPPSPPPSPACACSPRPVQRWIGSHAAFPLLLLLRAPSFAYNESRHSVL